ncbi:hypothetical protein [Sphingomonas faeni]|nr:hypothetical protein [Sphingomonas faeni]MCP8891547.1 hypothetical protein [Sphingomonas faeni]
MNSGSIMDCRPTKRMMRRFGEHPSGKRGDTAYDRGGIAKRRLSHLR